MTATIFRCLVERVDYSTLQNQANLLFVGLGHDEPFVAIALHVRQFVAQTVDPLVELGLNLVPFDSQLLYDLFVLATVFSRQTIL